MYPSYVTIHLQTCHTPLNDHLFKNYANFPSQTFLGTHYGISISISTSISFSLLTTSIRHTFEQLQLEYQSNQNKLILTSKKYKSDVSASVP